MLIRAGHTEASVDLARLAGLYPAAVICEIMNDDGTMARMPDLVPFAAAPRPQDRHHRGPDRLPPARTTTWSPRRQHARRERVRRRLRPARLRRRRSSRASIWRSSRAICPSPARCWCACMPSTCSATCSASARRASGSADRQVACARSRRKGRGVVVLIRDLRAEVACRSGSSGARATAKPAEGARERRQVEIGVGSQILRDLGVSDMVLLTNSPAHVYVGLEGFGLRIVGTRGSSERHGRQDRQTDGAARRKPPRGRRCARACSSSRRASTRRSPTSWSTAPSPRSRRRASSYDRITVPGALEIPQVLAQAVAAGLIPRRAASGTLGRRRRARLRHPRRDLALRHRLQQRQSLADGGRDPPRRAARQWHPDGRHRGAGAGARQRRRRRQRRRCGARLSAADRARSALSRGRAHDDGEQSDSRAEARSRCRRAPRRAWPPCRRSIRWTSPAPTSTT